MLQVIDVFTDSRQIFRSRAIRKTVKIKIHETMVKPVAVYGSETWVMTEMGMNRLGKWEDKILRIHGPMVEQGIWKIRTNQELRELYEDPDIVADIKKKTGMEWTCIREGQVGKYLRENWREVEGEDLD